MEKEKLEVWFAIDKRTSECGFVAAYSLLKHRQKDSQTRIRVAYEKGEPPPAGWWSSLLSDIGKQFSLDQIAVDLQGFHACKGVFDSRAAFLRILIPEYSDAQICLYTDADVVFQEDAGKLLHECDMTGKSVALIRSGACSTQPHPEQLLLNHYGKQISDDYFFSGLALINNREYKKQKIIENSLNLCRSHASELSFHDQTVWNCVLKNSAIIHPRWCHKAYPGKSIITDFQGGIVHFVGSPKPWDLFGEFFHPYSAIWYEAATRSGLRFPKARRYFQLDSWRRALRIKQQYRSWVG